MASLRDDCLPALHVWRSLTCAEPRGSRLDAPTDAAADALAALPFSARLSRAATASLVDDAFAAADGDEAAALGRLRARLDAAGVRLAAAAVQWHGVRVERATGAGLSPHRLPSLMDPARAAVAGFAACVGRGDASRATPALAGVAGVLRPRTLTLLLGPPGAGKTTLLRALSGRLASGRGVRVRGSVRLNGVEVAERGGGGASWPRTVAYVGAADAHLPTLTVAETLRFAEACTGGDPATRDAVAALIAADADAAAAASASHHPADAALDRVAAAVTNPLNGAATEWMVRVLRLAPAAHTVVGDALLRGISGGEKRRLSTAELLVGAARVLCLNAVSTGLDTGATLALATSLRTSADTLDVAVLASLLAPEPDAVALFDDVLLLARGRVLYHGAIEHAHAYFEGVGCDPTLFAPAPGTSVADALLAIATSASPEEAERLADAWDASPPGRALASDAAGPPPPTAGPPADLCRAGYAASWPILVNLCLRRAIKVDVKRNAAAYGIRWGLALAMSCVVGSLFLSPPLTVAGGQARLAALFFMLFFTLTLAVPVVETTFERRPIILRQRDDGLYPGAAELAAQAVIALPVSIIDAACAALPLSFLASLAPDPGRRAATVAVFALLSAAVDALYRAFGASFTALNNGIAVGVVLLLGLEMTAGFTLSAASIPPWWRWLHYVNPMAWAWRTLAIVEMTHARWGAAGDAVLATFDVPRSAAWAWGGAGFLVGFWVVALGGCCAAYTYKRAPEPTGGGGGGGAPTTTPAKTVAIDVAPADAAVLAPPPLALAAVGVGYSVPGPKNARLALLSNVTASFEPGTLTALMGASGAGKTTLLDVLAGRKTAGEVTGDIFVGGARADPTTLPRVAAYVEQSDAHYPLATVREAVEFAAALRLPRAASRAARAAAVDAALATAGLAGDAHAIVGPTGDGRGLSPDARKRLTLAVELAAAPSIIFADEPTSGLDGIAAAAVANALRAAADAGRTVVCTIHQPSTSVFASFDNLLLLARGGRVAYCGPLGGRGAPALVEHVLAAVPGTTPPPPTANPAAWAVSAVNVGAAADEWQRASADGDLGRPTSAAPAAAAAAARRASADGAGPGARPAAGPTLATQTGALCRRLWRGYGRDPGRNAARFAVSAAMAVLVASMEINKAAPDHVVDLQSLNNALGVVYLALVSLSFDVAFEAQPFLAADRVVFYRERAAQAYGPAPYALATLAVELPYLVSQTLLFAMPVAAVIGAATSAASLFYVTAACVLTTLALWLLAAALVALTPIVFLASLLLSVLTSLSSLFAGYFQPWSFSPAFWAWTRAVNPAAYGVAGVAAVLYGDVDTPIAGAGDRPLSTVLHDDYWFGGGRFPTPATALGALAGLCGLYAAVAYAGLKWINFQNR